MRVVGGSVENPGVAQAAAKRDLNAKKKASVNEPESDSQDEVILGSGCWVGPFSVWKCGVAWFSEIS